MPRSACLVVSCVHMAPDRVGIRELREDLSRAIRRVRGGETLEVTDRGQPVARIVPVMARSTGLGALVAAGKLRGPRRAGPLPRPLALRSRMTSEEAIDALRGE